MNIFQEIKTFFTVKSAAEELYKEVSTMNGQAPGWKTTEFWGKVVVQVGVLWGAVQGFVPPKYAAIITMGGESIYIIARTVLKMVQAVQAAKSDTTTITTTAPTTTVTTPA